MQETDLRHILRQLSVTVTGSRNTPRGLLLEAKCPLAPWYHATGKDNSPSFAAYVNDEGASGYICKACHNQGRITSLVTTLGRLREENYVRLASEASNADFAAIGRIPSYEENKERRGYAYNRPEALNTDIYLWLYEDAIKVEEARNYLSSRGISDSTADKLQLKYDPEKERILFPVFDRVSDLYGFTGRGIYEHVTPKVRDYAGLAKRYLVLGEERWQREKPLIIVEGLFGYAHLHEIGVESIANIGCIMGSEMTEEKALAISKVNNKVYLLLDNDKAGDAGIFGYDAPAHKKGAVHMLDKRVPLYIPSWDIFAKVCNADNQLWQEKDDPDQLTYEEIEKMLDLTPAYN